MGIGKETQ